MGGVEGTSTSASQARPALGLTGYGSNDSSTRLQSDNPYLEAGMRLYGDFEYEAALEQLKKASSFAGNTPADEVRIAIYRGLIKSELGDEAGAEVDFKTALAFDPRAELPRGVSPKIKERFEQARAQILASMPAAPSLPALPPPPLPAAVMASPAATTAQPAPVPPAEPSEETPAPKLAKREAEPQADERTGAPAASASVSPPKADLSHGLRSPAVDSEAFESVPTPSAAVAAPSTGASRVLASVLLGAGAAFGAGGAYFGYQSSQSVASARAAHFQSDGANQLGRARDQALAANVLYGAATAAIIGGFVALFAD
ncbi:MAG: hypothetical protein ACOX6T_17080 [Myxococcales bacterium]